MIKWPKLLVAFCGIIFLITYVNSNIVTLPSGTKIIGSEMKTWKARIFWSYQGIPYALPPIGKLRFEVNIFITADQLITIVYK